uniref:Kinetochore protein NDC80 n=1 Tax=Kalanchoe fedtschenkoi TaxID=63787 RepID=A0A7N0VEK7_KALFE
MRKGTGKRRTSAAQQPAPPAHHRPLSIGRDSDASYASSRPSSAGVKRSAPGDYFNDRGYQQAAIRAVNAFLKENSGPVERLQLPHPSAKDIKETLVFLMARLDYPTTETEIDEDLPILLKQLNSPFTLTKSVLRAPGNPHYWPTFLAIIHWLVQLVMYCDHTFASGGNAAVLFDNSISNYVLESYGHYLSGDDAAVDELDRVQILKMEEERDSALNRVNQLKEEVIKLEANLEGLRTRPSAREALEKKISMSEEDIIKFQAIISDFSGRTANLEGELDKKVKELEAKVEENNKICEENKELKKMIELQVFNARDAERMKRELQAVERDTVEAESARNAWEEKSWDLDGTISQKFKELEGLSMECNQALRRLKLGINIQYLLNSKGTTPADVLGIDYKAELKPALESLMNDIKKSSMEKLEESIFLKRQSLELVSEIKEKRNQITALEKHIDEEEHNLSLVKKDMEDHISRCEVEKQRVVQDFETEAHNLDNVEKEAADMLKAANLNLENTIRQTEAEIQKCAREFFGLVDCVSKCKEQTSSKITELRDELSRTAAAVSKVYKESLPAEFGGLFDESKLD